MYVRSAVQVLPCSVDGCQHRAYGVYLAGTCPIDLTYEVFKLRLVEAFETLKNHLEASGDEWISTMLEYREECSYGTMRASMQCNRVSGDMNAEEAASVMTSLYNGSTSRLSEYKKWKQKVVSVMEGPIALWLLAKSRNRDCSERVKQ